jgi:hypothetical protein
MELTIRLRTNKGGHWFYVHNCLFEQFEYPARQKPYLIAVYSYLARCADDKTQIAWPSQADISIKTGASVGMVKKIIKDLSARHLIVVQRVGRRHKTVNKYFLTHPTEWIMRSAYGVLGPVHTMPTNKTLLKQDKDIKELREAQIGLARKMKIRSFNANSP